MCLLSVNDTPKPIQTASVQIHFYCLLELDYLYYIINAQFAHCSSSSAAASHPVFVYQFYTLTTFPRNMFVMKVYFVFYSVYCFFYLDSTGL